MDLVRSRVQQEGNRYPSQGGTPLRLPRPDHHRIPAPPTPASTKPISLLFANITSWGRQAEQFLLNSSYDIFCVVEHHLDKSKLHRVEQRIRASGRDIHASAASPSGRSAAGTSAGVGIATRKSLCAKAIDDCLAQQVLGTDSLMQARWQAVLIRLRGTTILLVTTYLLHTIGLVGDNLILLEQVLLLIRAIGLPTIICGDWQMHPDVLHASDWPRRAGLVMALAKGISATCNINTERASYLDYYLASPHLLPLLTISPIFTAPWKTHIALELSLQASPHSYRAPVLRVPKQLPPLPLLDGQHVLIPETWQRAQQLADDLISKHSKGSGIIGLTHAQVDRLPEMQRSLSLSYAHASTCAEIYSCLIADIRVTELHRYIGRGHFTQLELKSPFPKNYGTTKFFCKACDTWARIETGLIWLTGVSKNGAGLSDHAVCKTVLELRALLPAVAENWNKVRKFNCPVHAWQQFLRNLTTTGIKQSAQGYNADRLQVWVSRATAQKEHAIKVRVRNQRKSFKDWLKGALQGGASVAHAFTRDNITPAAPVHDIDAAFKEWGKRWHDAAPTHQHLHPADSHDLLSSWSCWEKQVDDIIDHVLANTRDDEAFFRESSSRSDPGDILDFGVDEVIHAVNSYPGRKKGGADFWTSTQLRHLPYEVMRPFAAVLTGVQRNLRWPIQVVMNLGSLIPKPNSKGQRPISKTPFLYRIWCILRNETIKQWDVANIPPWDTASPGHSAETAAGARLWMMELAHLSGNSAAALLWDLDKFFDTIDLKDVRRNAVERDYPRRELCLAIAMHRAPRVLQMAGVSSCAILPLLSILQGCTHSSRFARLITWRPIERSGGDVNDIRQVDRSIARVSSSTFVDDVAQLAVGKKSAVSRALTIAGVSFAASIKRFRLAISCKSLVVASDLHLAKLISCTICKEAQVKLTACSSGRDLGLTLSGNPKRITSLQDNRLNKTRKRLQRIAPLARSLKAARKLIATGALPQVLWGSSSIGIAPTKIKQLRTMVAGACGIGGAGRCASTAIAISLGHLKDPEIAAVTKQVSTWIDVWRADSTVRALTTRYWSGALARVLVDGSVVWNRVCSPLSATIAVMHSNGWKLAAPHKWTDPSGFEWIADFDEPKESILQIVSQFVLKNIWSRAAEFESGRGLENGVHWHSTLQLHRRLSKVQSRDPEEMEVAQLEEEAEAEWPSFARSWLELFLASGYWTNERAARSNPAADRACPRCGYHSETALHWLWLCPKNRLIADARVQSTQDLISQAVDGEHSHPCLWLRGMLPLDLVHVNTPFSDTSEIKYIVREMHTSEWPSGYYCTDASGGEHNSFPILRRCGFGIVRLSDSFSVACVHSSQALTDIISFGAYGTLAGERHTVPRAELFAIVEVVSNVIQGATVHISTDSKVNVDLHSAGRIRCLHSSNSDLWRAYFEAVDHKSLVVDLQWCKGHPTMDLVRQHNITARDAVGNILADALAERGAKEFAVYSEDAFGAKWHFDLVSKIQKRAVIILAETANRQVVKAAARSAKSPLPTVANLSMQSQHNITAIGKVLHCFACHRHSAPGAVAARAFLATPCRPDVVLSSSYTAGAVRPTKIPSDRTIQVGHQVVHSSHEIYIFKGMHFCKKCGNYAVKRLLNLAKECEPRGKTPEHTARIRSAVVSLLQGKLPRGVSEHPNNSTRLLQLDS